ncbi:multidrug ABC transporter ATP-binding protein [Lysobacter helvus]|uniref:Multidrug ABC transporter ATP-binding protein n=2 Tax=Lysobacteraceae TaxID=32033 RepID=A0ABN6FQV3_9GAMM|nr:MULTISPECIES: ABC transporter ATP-binding protein [Lysobacter]BCT91983.1 multidrug ABC transporter ATP-binding protein [Lysobacter caseinilyticus]BCT95136.1 multidrug ABC transporter ATP-binding protein [Lysobacter helvus]
MRTADAVLARLHHASKSYGKIKALDGVDLALRGGELLALLGPNGAGKTTAIGLLLGLLRADAGTVELFGRDPQDIAARRNIGVMLQDAQLPATLRVGELIRLTASYYPSPRTVQESADLAGVADLLKRPYGKLSGGQQRRVQFALALCGRPKLLFLDEPTVGMDIQARQTLWAAIRHLVAEGNGVVLTTHYLEEAEALADRVCVMARGRIISEGSVDALRARVSMKRVRCNTTLSPTDVADWPGVVEATLEGDRLCIATEHAEAVVRRLLALDDTLSALEVRAAGLAEAFTELTRDDAVASLREAA